MTNRADGDESTRIGRERRYRHSPEWERWIAAMEPAGHVSLAEMCEWDRLARPPEDERPWKFPVKIPLGHEEPHSD